MYENPSLSTEKLYEAIQSFRTDLINQGEKDCHEKTMKAARDLQSLVDSASEEWKKAKLTPTFLKSAFRDSSGPPFEVWNPLRLIDEFLRGYAKVRTQPEKAKELEDSFLAHVPNSL